MNSKFVSLLIFCSLLFSTEHLHARKSTVRETLRPMVTYPYSDPSSIAAPSTLYYPYFRFDGFSSSSGKKEWKSVILENDYIEVTLFPEVGGKIWGAVDKTTGKEFIYDNSVVKFRDVGMRGPWVSGGIEFNFGIIGHAPTSPTPVDYLTREKPDGSASCYISSYDWITRTVWTVEVNLPADKGYFTTKTTWYNQSSVTQPYYQWMNAGYPVGEKAEFCYPGDHNIGHNGAVSSFRTDGQGRDLGWYNNNQFVGAKSYHILGYYNDFYGIYWHGEDYGSVHHAGFDEKLGMKIFLWGEDRAGGIWEDLLTDNDGQYIELQSGRMFNQPSSKSAMTPYKHFSFAPQQTDSWTEYWYPVKGTGGVVKASRIGALNVRREDGKLKLAFSPVCVLDTEMKIYNGGKHVQSLPMNTEVLQPVYLETADIPEGQLKVVIGDNLLVYSESTSDYGLERPVSLPEDFDWKSVFGLYTKGEQALNQKRWDEAEMYLTAALEKDRYFIPALNCLASLYLQEGRYEDAASRTRTVLSLDTYNGEANYTYALANRALGNVTEAKAALSVATYSASVRTAAYEQLGELYALGKDWERALHYASRSLTYNTDNLQARLLTAIANRKSGRTDLASEQEEDILDRLPLYHPARFEKAIIAGKGLDGFKALIRNELSHETYMELAGWYESIGCYDEALQLYACAGDYPIALYRMAYLQHRIGMDEAAIENVRKADALSPELVFPFRHSSLPALEWAASMSGDWKPLYYQALIYWTGRQTEKAEELMDSCSPAGFAPFYLSRAQLKHDGEQLEDLLKAESIGPSWRAGMALLNYYERHKDWDKSVETGRKYHKIYPDNYYISLMYASALCETGQYKSCTSLLNRTNVLPNEGSYKGRSVYRTAYLYQAIDDIRNRRFTSALKAVEASELWPEHLGVGKPYEDQIDLTLESYLKALAYSGLGKTGKTAEMYASIAWAPVNPKRFESRNLLIALALRESGKAVEADRMVASWSEKYPENEFARWCSSVYARKDTGDACLSSGNDSADNLAPWEMAYHDGQQKFVVRLFSKR